MTRLVYLHGLLGPASESEMWRPHFPEWDIVGLEVGVAPRWDIEVARLSRLVQDHDIVMGYSLGARLSLGIAIDGKTSLGGLVLISGNPGLRDAEERQARSLQDQSWSQRLSGHPPKEILREWYAQPVFDGDAPELLDSLIQEKLHHDLQAAGRTLLNMSTIHQPNYRPMLPKLGVPTLLIAGARDVKYTRLAREMADLLPRAQCEILGGAGHVVHRSHPSEVAAKVREFVEPMRRCIESTV